MLNALLNILPGRNLLVTVVLLLMAVVANAQQSSNKGKEFWTGYGHHQFFTTSQGDGEHMILYLSAEQPANVTVSINGTSWKKTYSIPANTVMPTDLIPKSGADDCRLTGEGLFNRGIHIVSDTPIVAYAHIYGQKSSGATMLLPVETYGYKYMSLNSEQDFASDCYSWFFVVASENNTRVRITPSQLTVGGQLRNQPFEVSLQQGQIYNVMGKIRSGSAGYDLSGSKIEAIEGTDGNCHPIAVFSGSSRTIICSPFPLSGGGDNIIQQVFPSRAWGTNYLVTLTKVVDGGPNVYNNNRIRVLVSDRTAVVKRNGVRLTGLVNNAYYDYLATGFDYITSDKPIMVAQYMPSGGGCGSTGLGDPEMFYISPIEQAIKKTIFYNTKKEEITNNFINLVVPENGLASLKIDGSQQFDTVFTHPNLAGYKVVIKELPAADMQHIADCDSAFTAITYGLGFAESYGYNAGTMLKDLDSKLELKNEYAIANTDYTCEGTGFTPILKTMYKPSGITWQLSNIKAMQPNDDVVLTNATPADSVVENGRLYYLYPLPGKYVFTDTGTFDIPVRITDPSIEKCSFTEAISLSLKVVEAPVANFSFSANTCATDSIQLTDQSPQSNTIGKWLWRFSDDRIDSVANPKKAFATAGNQTARLTIIRQADGCAGDTLKPITVHALPDAAFNAVAAVCLPDGKISFTNASSYVAGGSSVLKYEWQFGDGSNSADASPSHQYTTAGSFSILLKAITDKGCADTAMGLVRVNANPVVNIVADKKSICLGDTIRFSAIANPVATGLQWNWNFGDNTQAQTMTVDKKYNAAGSYNTYLLAKDDNGCVSDTARLAVAVHNKPTVAFQSPALVCMPSGEIVFTNETTVNGTNGGLQYQWILSNGQQSPNTDFKYLFNTIGNYTLKLQATTADGCIDSLSKNIQVSAKPEVSIATGGDSFCLGNTIAFTASNTGTVASWQWNFGDGSQSTAAKPDKSYRQKGAYTITLNALSAEGCAALPVTKTITILDKPRVDAGPSFTTAPGKPVTLNGSVVGTASSIHWSPAATLSSATSLQPVALPATTQVYSLTAVGEGSCSSTDSTVVTIQQRVLVPNAFSPNGDGINDMWRIPTLNDYSDVSVMVFNRWGNQVFASHGFFNGWDGKQNGALLPTGAFYYTIRYDGGKTLSGSVTLIR